LSAEADRDAFVVGDDWKAMLPDQLLEAGHLIRLTAEVDLAIRDSSPVEVMTQRSAMRAPVGGEHEDGVERSHLLSQPSPDMSFEF